MDVREKLMELLREFIEVDVWDNGEFIEKEIDFSKITENLLENGVTVQEWISVKDELPDDDEIVIICTDANFIYAGELIGDTWFLDNDSWTATVTHWMPLPQPPKGE